MLVYTSIGPSSSHQPRGPRNDLVALFTPYYINENWFRHFAIIQDTDN